MATNKAVSGFLKVFGMEDSESWTKTMQRLDEDFREAQRISDKQ